MRNAESDPSRPNGTQKGRKNEEISSFKSAVRAWTSFLEIFYVNFFPVNFHLKKKKKSRGSGSGFGLNPDSATIGSSTEFR
jgi:hypothetical protein